MTTKDDDTLVKGRERVHLAVIRVLADAFIEGRLQDPELTVALIVEALAISRSSLYTAFADAGGVHAAIRDARLDRAFALLAADTEKRTIDEISKGLGFKDYPTFQRAFRRRFGLSPRDVRRRIYET